MMTASKWLATCLGIGYIQKGAGTIAALFCCLIWYVARVHSAPVLFQLLILTFVFLTGVWASTILEKKWGHDSNRIVIDEVLGMGVGLILLPVGWKTLVIAFIVFRFFDIVKPLYIRKMEDLPSGWGVMADDLLAGIYTNIIMQVIVSFHFFKTL